MLIEMYPYDMLTVKDQTRDWVNNNKALQNKKCTELE